MNLQEIFLRLVEDCSKGQPSYRMQNFGGFFCVRRGKPKGWERENRRKGNRWARGWKGRRS